MLRKFLAGVSALLLALGLAAFTATPAGADQPDFICEGYAPNGTDTINTAGDPATVPYEAPDGYLIDEYCVKADTIKHIVTVSPPVKSIVIDHPDKDSVSHYAVHLVPECAVVPGIAASAAECVPPDPCAEVSTTAVNGYDECNPPPDCDTEVGEARFAAAAVDEECPGASLTVTGEPTHQTCEGGDETPGTYVPGEIQLYVSDLAGVTDISYSKDGGPSTSVDLAGNLLITGLDPGDYDFVVTVADGYDAVAPFSVTVNESQDPSCKKVEICHWTEGEGGKYVEIEVSKKSIFNVPNGHDLHPNDKIPSFEYNDGDDVLTYPGKNGGTGEGCDDLPDLPTHGPVEPLVVFTAPTCEADGSYELISPEPLEGKSSTTVFWFVNGDPVEPGLYKAAAGTSVTIKVDANGPDYTLEDLTPSRTYPEHVFAEPDGDCDLTTLALTGQDVSPSPALTIAGFLGLLGLAMVRTARRTARFRTEG